MPIQSNVFLIGNWPLYRDQDRIKIVFIEKWCLDTGNYIVWFSFIPMTCWSNLVWRGRTSRRGRFDKGKWHKMTS